MFWKCGSPLSIFVFSFLAVASTYASASPKSFVVLRISAWIIPACFESWSSTSIMSEFVVRIL